MALRDPGISRRIASKACDFCRQRKSRCLFESETDPKCRKCTKCNVQCTFYKDRKIRGPRSQPLSALVGDLPLPISSIGIEQFLSEDLFLQLLSDFNDFVYPLFPLVHRPSFQALLHARAYDTDPAFFRQCVALCALTISSIPSNISKYGHGRYADMQHMVDKACRIVALSRLATDPTYHDKPSPGAMLDSTLLATAAHYAGRPNLGWSYANEAIVTFRKLQLYKVDGYSGLTAVEAELCKRAFWLLYIIQIHDRFTSVIPHTVLGFLPAQTDWDFIFPAEISDEELSSSSSDTPSVQKPTTPLISGFLGLVKIFLCLGDLFTRDARNLYLGTYPDPSGILRNFSPSIVNADELNNAFASSNSPSMNSLRAILSIMTRLRTTLNNLPVELQLSYNHQQTFEHIAEYAGQFEIVRATIHIQSLYLQSTVIETFLGPHLLQRRSGGISSAGTSPSGIGTGLTAAGTSDVSEIVTAWSPNSALAVPAMDNSSYHIATELWRFREAIAKDLLEILSCTPARTLDMNGTSLILQIRKVAATLLDRDDGSNILSDVEERSQMYIERFAEILARLDNSSPRDT